MTGEQFYNLLKESGIELSDHDLDLLT